LRLLDCFVNFVADWARAAVIALPHYVNHCDSITETAIWH
jgi:hypothetical protein